MRLGALLRTGSTRSPNSEQFIFNPWIDGNWFNRSDWLAFNVRHCDIRILGRSDSRRPPESIAFHFLTARDIWIRRRIKPSIYLYKLFAGQSVCCLLRNLTDCKKLEGDRTWKIGATTDDHFGDLLCTWKTRKGKNGRKEKETLQAHHFDAR